MQPSLTSSSITPFTRPSYWSSLRVRFRPFRCTNARHERPHAAPVSVCRILIARGTSAARSARHRAPDSGTGENFVQNIEDGWDARCPDSGPPPGSKTGASPAGPLPQSPDVAGGEDPSVKEKPSLDQLYSADTFALAVVTSIVTSFVVGFILGYIFSRRCRKEHPSLAFNPYSDPTGYTDYQIHHPMPDPHHGYTTQLGTRPQPEHDVRCASRRQQQANQFGFKTSRQRTEKTRTARQTTNPCNRR